jgi:hypothetical protein
MNTEQWHAMMRRKRRRRQAIEVKVLANGSEIVRKPRPVKKPSTAKTIDLSR